MLVAGSSSIEGFEVTTAPDVTDLPEIHEPLLELGRQWVKSPHRPRPAPAVLGAWDELLSEWLRSDLPLLLRNSGRRGERVFSSNGRAIVFADNSPATWAFESALGGEPPNIGSWTSATLATRVRLSIVAKGPAPRLTLNERGWKVCHIDPVSDRKRTKLEDASFERLEAQFRRFLSPRNMFLVPKAIAGAGELSEVINAIREFEKANS